LFKLCSVFIVIICFNWWIDYSWLQVEDDVGRYLPTAEQQKNCQVIDPKETCKAKTGEVIHKDDWTIDALKHDVHGYATKHGLGFGLWLYVTPSMEWKIEVLIIMILLVIKVKIIPYK